MAIYDLIFSVINNKGVMSFWNFEKRETIKITVQELMVNAQTFSDKTVDIQKLFTGIIFNLMVWLRP